MGQKVNPHGMRVGIIKGWSSQWYADKKDFARLLKEDNVIREFLKKKYYSAAVSSIEIERSEGKISVTMMTARPGVLIGKGGANVEIIKNEIAKLSKGNAVSLNIVEVKKPDMDAQLVAEGIAAQLEKRVSFRRAVRQNMGRAMRAGAKGIKAMVSGRLDGAEIARSEHYHEGSIPLHTLRADIDYGFAEAHTTFGVIGVKVWIYKGEILAKKKSNEGGQANVNA
ncbi:MAG TPA: 30S ribosomal protein S3 [Firmicutes bacterium]|nr:30S ribosomal protein S3 [Bacillota bacterium]